VNDTTGPAEDNDENFSEEDAARFMRRYHLGAVAEASATMESVLRGIFSSLLGSPRATVVAAGQNVTWLANNALAVVDANDAVRAPSLGEPENVARFRASIVMCRDLYAQRNRLIHGVWVDWLPDGRPGLSQLRSKWRQPWPLAEEVDLEDVEKLSSDLEAAVSELIKASFEVKGIIAGT